MYYHVFLIIYNVKLNGEQVTVKSEKLEQMNNILELVVEHQRRLESCRLCPQMIPPVITCRPIDSKILLIGQAPGDREGVIGQPFAWTAGKTLFQWFNTIGVDEETFRQHVYMSAVCRCFPGKNPKGGDRVPDKQEILNCSQWLRAEFEMLKPELVLLVGKLAINQFLTADKLVDVIGQSFQQNIYSAECDVIPLPHPSGASTWHRMEPGKALLKKALKQISRHAAWKLIT